MAEPFIGEIRPFAFDYPPRGWAACNGQLLAINTNQALFSILGTTYGGNGTTNFALPNLQGRAPVHAPGASSLGEAGGAETVTLTQANLPAHAHGVMASADLAASTSPSGNVMGAKGRGGATVYAAGTNLTPLAPGAVGLTGENGPHENMQPSLAVNFCIALFGIFPSRN